MTNDDFRIDVLDCDNDDDDDDEDYDDDGNGHTHTHTKTIKTSKDQKEKFIQPVKKTKKKDQT